MATSRTADTEARSLAHWDEAGVAAAWDRDNEQWWDWYMSLADDDLDGRAAGPLLVVEAPDPGPVPSDDEVVAELAEPYAVPSAAVEGFAADG